MGRKVKNYEKINADDEVLLAENLYNEIGQLKTKELNNGDQKTNYTYNERGWLKSSKSDQFSQQLKYQDGTNPQFNGNISDQLWGAGNTLANNFVYTYDKLNRLSSGVGPGMSEAMSYDLMGNIQSLKRDNITRNYTYNGNRLNQITGGTEKSAYAYDDNGNAIVDGKNGQAISYNNLNLPVKIAGLDLSYVYDAAGNKLKKIKGGLVTDYIEGIQYTAGVIEFIQTETGLARRKDNSYGYEYNLTDNLGNVRYSFYKNPVTNKIERLQSDDYYPFGLRKSSGNTVSLNNKYLYNGKELQDELGQYDYGARFYDPVIGRWNVLDAKSELYFQITPYAYAANTPTNAIDPNGHIVIFINGNFYDGTGGSPKYWRGFTVGSNYDDTKSYHPWFFDKAVMNRFKDHNESLKGTSFNAYIDGSLGGHAPNNGNLKLQNRIDAGYEQGQQDAAVLINSLARTNGVITESLKIVTHSMGAAFGKGYIKAIIEYAKAHPKLARGLSITEYDFAAFQQNKLSAIPGVPLFQFDNIGDDVVSGAIGYSNGSWHAKQSGREENGSNDNVLSYGGHDIGDFMRAVSTLSVGTYKFINGKFVRQ
ncbi:hypothetical protein TH53_24120 [Pedobacter lusitanus]|uniref:RHS repeat-associated core domain-containing protein n=2 Tax=Pedobacter lusitanus TaxID=1503925 RepID=A0A0D0EZT5_9SPHI|nr:RHS repeat-associated core domain-containing protein [Pedobacter lusitanus]KIO74848.1 hypothetical protein TH53_24120 [Pedobacter lusitanus]